MTEKAHMNRAEHSAEVRRPSLEEPGGQPLQTIPCRCVKNPPEGVCVYCEGTGKTEVITVNAKLFRSMCETGIMQAESVLNAIDVAVAHADARAPEHKAWVIDQMVRRLTCCPLDDGAPPSEEYRELIDAVRSTDGADSPYVWDTGVAPERATEETHDHE